jgi:hypothetical protein
MFSHRDVELKNLHIKNEFKEYLKTLSESKQRDALTKGIQRLIDKDIKNLFLEVQYSFQVKLDADIRGKEMLGVCDGAFDF